MTKLGYATKWFDAGVCPGCGAPLELVTGLGDGHRPDGTVWQGGLGAIGPVCSWTPDQLTALVHVATGTVKVLDARVSG